MGKPTFKEALMTIVMGMTYMGARPTKEQAKKAIDGTLKDNAKVYELLAGYDNETHVTSTRKLIERNTVR